MKQAPGDPDFLESRDQELDHHIASFMGIQIHLLRDHLAVGSEEKQIVVKNAFQIIHVALFNGFHEAVLGFQYCASVQFHSGPLLFPGECLWPKAHSDMGPTWVRYGSDMGPIRLR